ncbi:unnamed protein product [Arabidopsis lyrata]|uniref:ATOFP17/OFP17 n=2 Tax=Arabidopsis lyrata subsp. lyrata TaxID=81972 RepID=D7LBN3_ARALL|nr:ATOFP17/OFP17 [Arabidopsis lyrata subsp. lyrata]CAH8264239.1 unnamed protein product [Arabidopsis lyrata]
MRVKATLINFKSKLSKSCNRFVSLFRFRVKRPVFIRPLRARHGNVKPRHQHHHPKKPICSCLCFLSTSKNHKMSKTKPRSSSFSVNDDDYSKFMHSPLTPATAKKLFTSPITTPYSIRTRKSLNSREAFEDNAVEDACRSFENYLIHLIVEEGKIDDLMDIEELLFCWKNLKSPVFIELVSRFYGELCRDLFSGE